MEPEGSLPHSQELAACPYRELCCTKCSVQVRGLKKYFVTSWEYYGEQFLAARPTPKLEDHPLSAVHDCAATIHIWWLFFYRQPEYPLNVTFGIAGCCVSDWTNADRQFE